MKYIIFGTGRFYQNRKEMIRIYDEEGRTVLFFDNAAQESGSRQLEGVPVVRPEAVGKERYDKVLLMSLQEEEMREQLLGLGFRKEDLWSWQEFLNHYKLAFFTGSDRKRGYRRRILLITTDMGYNGGTLAITYAARALSRDNEVLLMAPGIDTRLAGELREEGLPVLVSPVLPYIGAKEKYIIRGFDAVIVNVFQMLPAVFAAAAIRPVVWWIHEFGELYEETMEKYGHLADREVLGNIHAYAVSRIPQGYFNAVFPGMIRKTLPYGIPDWEEKEGREKEGLVFALLGGVQKRKGTDLYAQAAAKLRRKWKEEEAEFWVVGGSESRSAEEEVRRLAEGSLELKGLMTREQIKAAYEEIDVVVCPSREDPLPIVMTEGMMCGKVCIASDRTGTAELIREKENGLVCRAGDAESLAEAMEWVLTHREACGRIGREARKTYEEIFSMEAFRKRLEEALEEAEGDRAHEL